MSNLDPNLAAVLVALVASLGGWLVGKIRGEKQASLVDRARDLVDQALHVVVVTADANLDVVRAKATEYVWKGLERVGIGRNATSELLVAGAIEAGITAALSEARAHDRLVLVEVAKAQAAIKASLPANIDDIGKLPTIPTIPNILEGVDVEVLEPNRDGPYHPGYPIR